MVRVVFEDPLLLIVEKPAGIPTQPLARHWQSQMPRLDRGEIPLSTPRPPSETVASILAEQYPELRSVGGSDWGSCHRLDTDTSGLVVFARDQKTYEAMREAFSKDRVQREYLALVEGRVTQGGKIDWPVGPDPKSSKKVKVYKNLREARRAGAQEAVTVYEPVVGANLRVRPQKGGQTHRSAPTTLLHITIKGGRRHQIRGHLAAIGHSVIRLHASRLKFIHPQTNQWVTAGSPVPFAGEDS